MVLFVLPQRKQKRITIDAKDLTACTTGMVGDLWPICDDANG
jgi:hypothetical protein